MIKREAPLSDPNVYSSGLCDGGEEKLWRALYH